MNQAISWHMELTTHAVCIPKKIYRPSEKNKSKVRLWIMSNENSDVMTCRHLKFDGLLLSLNTHSCFSPKTQFHIGIIYKH